MTRRRNIGPERIIAELEAIRDRSLTDAEAQRLKDAHKRLRKRPASPSRRFWTPEEDAMLRSAVSPLGRTNNACSSRLRYLSEVGA